MPQLLSPRLNGVPVLRPEATGPEYTRWRRGVKSAFAAKGTWGFCDGTRPMPMPQAGPTFFSPNSPDAQPTLLEERKAWVKQDRDVKLDIFLSIADDIKLEVFEVGPPLPPSSLTAKDMIEALDERFSTFRFEEFHHIFCHFLNLHIDQYSNLADFNAEYSATLEDLLNHGHPMSNTQACSAYFSKLRCTQNPWVVKQLKYWDSHESEPQLEAVMTQSPPWSIIRPLTTKSVPAHGSLPEVIEEQILEETPAYSDGEDTPSEHSEVATIYSQPSPMHSRQSSRATTKSQEITVHASYEDLSDLRDFPSVPLPDRSQTLLPKRASSIAKFASLQPLPALIDRALPPLPPIPTGTDSGSIASSRSASPTSQSSKTTSDPSSTTSRGPSSMPSFTSPPSSSSKTSVHSRSSSANSANDVHPTLRPIAPTPTPIQPLSLKGMENVHPALRAQSAQPTSTPVEPVELPADVPTVTAPSPTTSHSSLVMRSQTPSPPMTQAAFVASSPNLSVDVSANPLVNSSLREHLRPQSSRSATSESFSAWAQTRPLQGVESNNSSMFDLPLQGATFPEFRDTTIMEAKFAPKPKRELSKMDLARLKFEGLTNSPPRSLFVATDDEKRARKKSWSIKSRLSARHGVREII